MRKNYLFKLFLSFAIIAGLATSSTAQITYTYTGAPVYYVVGAGVTSIAVDAQGAPGGTGGNGTINDHGGNGGRVQCTLAVTPGQLLTICVGGNGGNSSGVCCGATVTGGYNGGGNALYGNGGSGGGATDIRIGGTALSNRVIVAGGGGGGGFSSTSIYFDDYEKGGVGGGLTGGSGYYDNFILSGYGGAGGSAIAGGTGGTIMCTAGNGSLGLGGNSSATCYGGGGGGGFYGGGGGSTAGGGGGSSYTHPTLATSVTHTSGFRSASNGIITITPACSPVTGGTIVGPSSRCVGTSTTLTDSAGSTGGTWSSSNPSIASIDSLTGVVTAVSPGAVTITYTVSNACHTSTASATFSFTVVAVPTVTLSSTYSTCGGIYTLTALGGTTYSWAPSTGLSCATCSTTTYNPNATTSFTVSGTTSGCSGYATITVDGNRVNGHVTFSGTAPDTLDMKVWLIKFNAADSSISALDSTFTCLDAGVPYYEFMDKPAGNYMVKGKMLFGSYAGMSGYMPTYSTATTHWYSAATATHASATDILNITMQYGTVPTGPGFISGYVVSGAGRGTTGDVPAVGMLIYLLDATTHLPLTYAITNSGGLFSFGSIAYGNYIIHPEEYDFNTIPSATVTLSATTPSATHVDFRQYMTSRIIKPYSLSSLGLTSSENDGFNLYPNPASNNLNITWSNQLTADANLVITDMTGRIVLNTSLAINGTNGKANLSLEGLVNGTYLVSIKSASNFYTSKLQIVK